LDVFRANVRIIIEDLFVGPPGGEKIDDELDCNAGAFDHWLANDHLGINGDMILPLHSLTITVHRADGDCRARGSADLKAFAPA